MTSCGSCYFGIFIMQLIVFALTPIILYFFLLGTLMKKWKIWKLYKPSLDIIIMHDYDKYLFLPSLLIGSVTMIFMIPITLITCVPVWAFMLYRILKVFAIRFCCCFS